MMETANYTLEAQTKLLTFIFARVVGLMGPDERPTNPTMLTIDGSPCEGSWVRLIPDLRALDVGVSDTGIGHPHWLATRRWRSQPSNPILCPTNVRPSAPTS